MARTVTLSGQTYTIPDQGDVGWGSLSSLLERLTEDVNTLNNSSLATPTPLRRRVREITTSPTTLLSTDDVVLVSIAGLASINLPDPSTIDVGKVITIKDISGAAFTNTISIFGFGGATIDGASQYDINENYGDASFVLRDDDNWSRIQSLDSSYENGLMPIGTIFAITTHLAGSFTLPAPGVVKRGLMRCDGSAIPSGQTLSGSVPNLTDERFIRGVASVTGGSGDATNLDHTHTFAHTHTTNSALGSVNLSHDHSAATGAQTASFTAGTIATSGGAASFDKTELNTNQNSHGHSYGVQTAVLAADMGYLTGSEMIGIRNYNAGGFTGWTYTASVGTFASTFNNNSAATTKGVTATLRESTASTQFQTATWNSATVNTTFTQPTLDKATLNTDQTAHTHSIASDLTSVNFAHTHTTNSQSTSDTGGALSFAEIGRVQPKYFDAIYLIRVS